jgi:glycosyltransferase involved in cell wall biosynthesis
MILVTAQVTDVVIIDPDMKDFLGHYYAYDAAVANGIAEIGHRPLVLAHRDVDPTLVAAIGGIPTFRRSIWNSPRGPRLWSELMANLSFLVDLIIAVRRQYLSQHTVFFAHTFVRGQILALALLPALLRHHPEYSFIYLLRYEPGHYQGRVSRLAFRLLRRLAGTHTIRLASDSERLAREFARLTTLPIEVLPIPHLAPIPAAEPRCPADSRCHFVSLGNPRDEKGIFEILEAIRWLASSGQIDGCRFTLQCNDAAPDVAAAITEFRKEHLPNCTLILTKLATSEYDSLLASADVVLLPYWHCNYASRTSGVFMEALSAAKPVIATKDTWMSDQLVNHGAGLLCADRDAMSLARTMLEACEQRDHLATRAQAGRAAWVATHNPLALASRLLTPAPPNRGVAMS